MPQPPRHKSDDLETGFTTGTCATATSKAALKTLITGETYDRVSVDLPIEQELELEVWEVNRTSDEVTYAIEKDAGDDPDITDGATIYSTVEFVEENGVHFKGGKGVGTVTRPGMPVDPGEPAINPVPRSMMESTVELILQAHEVENGVTLTISVENGVEMAERTLNPRLGIEGGISILGTTGIVEPYSHASYIASIEQGIDVAQANGLDTVVLSTGGRTEENARSYHDLPDMAYVQFAGYLEETLDHLVDNPVGELYIYMMPGKFSKLMQGHVRLHSDDSTVDSEEIQDEILECFDWSASERQSITNLESTNQLISFLSINQARELFSDWVRRAFRIIADLYGSQLDVNQLCLHVMNLQGEQLARICRELSPQEPPETGKVYARDG
ncbi:MAG: cobalt-precorrin-5B (C(1))-methyltransferase [bacterium]